jgi:hypothetical protein
MSTEPKTFDFSERFLAERRRVMNVIAATMVALMLFGMLTAMDFDMRRLVASTPILVGIAALILTIFFVQTRYIFNRWRQMKLHFGPDGLIREAGAIQQTVTWDSITKVCFRYNPRGEPRAAEIFTAHGRPLALFGYESMSEVFGLIKDSIPPTAQVKIKRQWLNRENPLVIVSIAVVIVLLLEVIRRIGGGFVYENINSLIQIALGVSFLFYGPLSRTNPNFRRWEIAVGVLIMVSALITLITKVVELAR